MSDTIIQNMGADSPTPVPTNITQLDTHGVGNRALRATSLGLFIIVGFVGNCVLVATIAQSGRLKGSVLNLFIVSAAAINLLDCIINMPMILGATITEEWDYGDFVCHLNACFMQLVGISTLFSLMLMSLDRLVAVKNPSKYSRRMTVTRANLFIIYSWLHSACLSIPLMLRLDPLPVRAFTTKYLCSLDHNASVVYIAMSSLLGYLLPALLIIVFYIVIIKIGIQEKIRERKLSNPQAYVDSMMEESPIWSEVGSAKFVGVLLVVWIIFQGPYQLLSTIEQYRNSDKLEASDIFSFTYPWQLDLSLTWMRLCHPIFLPLLTFLYRKDMWQKFKNIILCRKSNLIIDASPKRSPNRRKAAKDTVTTTPVPEDNSVPVFFATENGLHFETYGKQADEDEESIDYKKDAGTGDIEVGNGDISQVVTSTKCDVYGSQDLLQLDDGDTSDYNSQGEVDPYSTSDPLGLSVKTEYGKATEFSQGSYYNRDNNEENKVDVPILPETDNVTAVNEFSSAHTSPLENQDDSVQQNTKKKRRRRTTSETVPENDTLTEKTHSPRNSEGNQYDSDLVATQTNTTDSGLESGTNSREKKKKNKRSSVPINPSDNMLSEGITNSHAAYPEPNTTDEQEQRLPPPIVPRKKKAGVDNVSTVVTTETMVNESDATAISDAPVPSQSPKVRKKKKRRERLATDGSVEMTNVPVAPRPLPRLKQSDRKSSAGDDEPPLSNEADDTVPVAKKRTNVHSEAKHPSRQISAEPSRSEDVQLASQKPPSRCKSEPNLAEKDAENTSVTRVKPNRVKPPPKTDAFITPKKDERSGRHQRKRNPSENSSYGMEPDIPTDLSDLSEINTKESSDTYLDSSQNNGSANSSGGSKLVTKARRQKRKTKQEKQGDVPSASSQLQLLQD